LPRALSDTRLELAPLGLDSGARGYNPCCRDTASLPPSAPKGKQESAARGNSRCMAEPTRPLPGTRPELAPLGLDSGTRGYNPRCRDTVDLPPPVPRGKQKGAMRGNGQCMAEPACAHHRRRKPGHGWALRVFIKTPASLPRPSVPPTLGTASLAHSKLN